MTKEIAPLQLLMVGFEGPKFEGRIAKELDKLRGSNLVRIVDGVVIYKNSKGEVEVQEKSDLSFEEAGQYGAVIGALLGVGSGSAAIVQTSAEDMAASFERRYEFGLDKEDLADITENMENDTAGLVLLLEHLWAQPLRDALRDAGGVLLAQDFLSPELLISIGQLQYESKP